MHGAPTSLRRNRGAVIVLVLVTVLLASFLLAAFLRRSGTELLADVRAAEMKQLRAEAYSALETTLAILADQRAVAGALHSPLEPWSDALADSGYVPGNGRVVEVLFEDESGKLPLATATETELQTLMEFAGIERNEAERQAAALHAWMREGGDETRSNFNAPDYSRNDPAYRIAKRPLRSWGELAAVAMDRPVFFDEGGRPTPEFAAFVREVSLHPFQKVNLNSAQAGVLTALGLGSAEVGALENHRVRPKSPGDLGVFRTMTEAGTVMGATVASDRFGTSIEVLRIMITARQGGVAYRLAVVISTGTGALAPRASAPPPQSSGGPTMAPAPERKMLNYPFAVLEIREDAEPFTPLSRPDL